MKKFNIFLVFLFVAIIVLVTKFNSLKQSPEADAVFTTCTSNESRKLRSEMTEDNFIAILNEITATCIKARNNYVVNRLTYGLIGSW